MQVIGYRVVSKCPLINKLFRANIVFFQYARQTILAKLIKDMKALFPQYLNTI